MLSVNIYNNVLYAGGPCLHLGGETTRSLGAFPLSLVGSPAITANSMRYAGGGVQFELKALGVPQATVLVSSNLNNWTLLQTVPLVGGIGLFTDPSVLSFRSRFYRVSVP